eukprot:Skav232855  [mRNA]  locus=scaffold2451:19147:20982:- [translate_table: standard]
MAWALLWATQLIDDMCSTSAPLPTVVFNFDAMVTGYNAKGTWRSIASPQWQQLLRSLSQHLQHRGASVEYQHVKAHTGIEGNEIADYLANLGATMSPLPEDPVQRLLTASDLAAPLQWLWALPGLQSGDPALPSLRGTRLVHEVKNDKATPLDITTGFPLHHRTTSRTHQLVLQIATANVLTLQEDRQVGLQSGRPSSLAHQFAAVGATIVCLQETRHHGTPTKAGDYIIFGHPATSQGTEGVQVWLHSNTPLVPGGQPFTKQHVRLIWSCPHTIILRLCHPDLKCVLVNTHSPHSGLGETVLESHWASISSHLRRAPQDHPVLMACDANAHLGSINSTSIGAFGQQTENLAGRFLREWVQLHSMWLPATFEETHQGSHDTYWTPDGTSTHRLDYLVLPLDDRVHTVTNRVLEEVDLATTRIDHLAVMCTFTLQTTTSQRRGRKPRFDVKATQNMCSTSEGRAKLTAALQTPSWTTSVHHHNTCLAQQVRSVLPRQSRRTAGPIWKRHLAEDTWEAIQHKASLHQQILQHRRLCQRWLLGTIVTWWRARRSSPLSLYTTALALQDQCAAQLWAQWKRATAAVKHLVRRDDQLYYAQLAEEAGQVVTQQMKE